MSNLKFLIERVEKATGQDREADLAIHLAIYPDGDIAGLMKYRRGLDSQEGYAWTIHGAAVLVEKWTADGRCTYNAGCPLPAYTASLDAVMALMPEGYEYDLTNLYGVARASVGLNSAPGPFYGANECGCMHLALLSAILQARLAMELSHD